MLSLRLTGESIAVLRRLPLTMEILVGSADTLGITRRQGLSVQVEHPRAEWEQTAALCSAIDGEP